MLGGSEDDLCRPTRSNDPGFQLLDGDDWLIPPRPANWTERHANGEGIIKMKKKKKKKASTLKAKWFLF